MIFLFSGLARVDVSLEFLVVEVVVTINASPGREVKSLMARYPLSFLEEGVYSNKQTKDKF